jgi:hypothetical protein
LNCSIGSCPSGDGRYVLTVRNRIPQGGTFKRFRLSWAEYREAFDFWQDLLIESQRRIYREQKRRTAA